MNAAEKMILRTTPTSPYGRKTRIAALVLGLADRIEIIPADTLDADDDLRAQNPLGKMPCLLVGGQAIYDSRVIVEYFDALAGGGRLIPPEGLDRFRALTRATLADGIADAGLLMTYERRFREDAQVSPRWLDHQRGKVLRALAAMVADPPDPRVTDVASISLACALSYLDWREQVNWREAAPSLTRWLEAFAIHEPAYLATERPS